MPREEFYVWPAVGVDIEWIRLVRSVGITIGGHYDCGCEPPGITVDKGCG